MSEPKTIDAAVTTLIHTHTTHDTHRYVADEGKQIMEEDKERVQEGLETSHLCSKSSPY